MRHVVPLSMLIAAALCGHARAAGDVQRPNILVILVDDMGYSDLGCYGSEIRTPRLDALAANGIRYTQMYNTSKCWTTRISLLTGLYHHRTSRNFERTAMISEVLGPAGYHTWWSGKHHARFNPHERGFDHFSGFLGGAINYWSPGEKGRAAEPRPGYEASHTWAFDDKLVKPFTPGKGFYSTDAFTDWALQWMDERHGDTSSKQWPFFLYVAYNAPHWPLHAYPEDIEKYKSVYDVGYGSIRVARYQRQIEMGLFDAKTASLSERTYEKGAWKAFTTEQRHAESMRMAVYAAMIDRVDQNVGRLIDRLKSHGELDNTLILFLVDNGACSSRPKPNGAASEPWGSVGTFEAVGSNWANVQNTPLRLWKLKSHEGGINTPMIAHWPAGIADKMRGKFYREPCHLVDMLPTFIELAGEKAMYPGASNESNVPHVDGVSIAQSFCGESLGRGGSLFFQYGSDKAVRDGPWKAIQSKTKPWVLYNLVDDRTETRELAKVEPDRVRQMEQEWHAWYERCTGNAWAEPVTRNKRGKRPKSE